MSRHEDKRALGERAEEIVAAHLVERGFSILARNARVGHKELDVIARRGGLVVVCEVRARSSADFADPLETISASKIRHVRAAAAEWLSRSRWRGAVRFDAASVVFDVPGGRLDYIEDAF